MTVDFKDEIGLDAVADSGQCFRWNRIGKGDDPVAYRIIAGGRVLFICRENRDSESLDMSCREEEYASFWRAYLDSGMDYASVRSSVDENDVFLSRAASCGKGIRILRQEPWETLISFIISQRKSIPAIKTTIEKLCEKAGKRLHLSGDEREWLKSHGIDEAAGEGLYAFPTAEAICALSSDDLLSCSAGYRAPYIRKAAEDVLSGNIDLKAMEGLNDEELLHELMKIYGVGKKVANCTALFGFHRLDLFPIDVWIERVLSEYYKDGFPFDRYRPYNGVMQQYMFYYAKQGKI